MKTVGELLHQARLNQKKSIEQLASETKIRSDYLRAIERNQFELLPAAAFVKGFIQTYARAVRVDPHKAIAVFRRDFDQNQHGKIVPRGMAHPLATPAKVWNPRTTTFVLGSLIFVLVSIYGFFQLRSINAAPPITIAAPTAEAQTGSIVEVRGKTSTDATLQVNNQPVSLDIEGNFSTSLNLSPGTHTIVIQAQSRDGKTSTETRTITVTEP